LKSFFAAEAYHQNYLVNHPDEPYIVYNDLPKLEHLRKQLPELYRRSRRSRGYHTIDSDHPVATAAACRPSGGVNRKLAVS
jgi:hypothetical protein